MYRPHAVVVLAAALAATFTASQTFADWTQFDLPNLADVYSPTAIANLPDGQYIFANEGNYYLQDAFGSASYTAYTNTAPGNNADPSFIAVWDSTEAVAGGGTFGPSDLYSFNPSSTSAPTVTGCTSVGTPSPCSAVRSSGGAAPGGAPGAAAQRAETRRVWTDRPTGPSASKIRL